VAPFACALGTVDAVTSAEVRNLVARTLGVRAFEPEPMTFGHSSITFRVPLDDGADVIVRTHRDPGVFAHTEANIEQLRALGLPVPRVLATDLTLETEPFAWMLTDAFPGRDLKFELGTMTRQQQSTLAEHVTLFQRSAMTLPLGDGFGFSPLGVPAPHATWVDAMRSDREAALSGDGEFVGPVCDALAAAEADLVGVQATCFLDDLTIKNVIVEQGELTGLVDFDVVCFGDPVYWLALTQVAVIADVDEPGHVYIEELLRHFDPSPEELERLRLYSALHGLEFLTYDLASARRTRLERAMRSWLTPH
jgi:aminoglycoside phosphotransferase (APT) family kinase protein